MSPATTLDYPVLVNQPEASQVATPARLKTVHRKIRKTKILLVTPELGITQSLAGKGKTPPCMKAGGLADICALLVDSFSESGTEVHVAAPHFRSLSSSSAVAHPRLHLCQDREFYYRRSVYEGCAHSNLRASLAFQRDVIHYVLPRVRPDIVHCHDWMTGLVPAAARAMGIASVFTLHNLHDQTVTLAHAEDRGIDAAQFWQNLYFQHYPGSYESARDSNPVSLLASGIMAADHVNTVSQGFLNELAEGRHQAPWPVADALGHKLRAGCATGILNGLADTFSPELDPYLVQPYRSEDHSDAKQANKRALQLELGLELNPSAPLLFWPSRLDPVQKGCGLLADILGNLLREHWNDGLQIAFVADGPFETEFRQIAESQGFGRRIGLAPFSERLSRIGYAASDFTLMPSAYEPCGLSQMIALRYGSLPIVHATGGLRDTVSHVQPGTGLGNGFRFDIHDAAGLRWAIGEALDFFRLPEITRATTIARVMNESKGAFASGSMIDSYRNLYDGLRSRRADS